MWSMCTPYLQWWYQWCALSMEFAHRIGHVQHNSSIVLVSLCSCSCKSTWEKRLGRRTNRFGQTEANMPRSAKTWEPEIPKQLTLKGTGKSLVNTSDCLQLDFSVPFRQVASNGASDCIPALPCHKAMFSSFEVRCWGHLSTGGSQQTLCTSTMKQGQDHEKHENAPSTRLPWETSKMTTMFNLVFWDHVQTANWNWLPKGNMCFFYFGRLLQQVQPSQRSVCVCLDWFQEPPLKAQCHHWLHPASGKMPVKGPWQRVTEQKTQ